MSDDPTSTKDKLQCLRCRADLESKGTQSFHHGRRWGVLGDLGELFVSRHHFDIYVCPSCGHVEFFSDAVGKALRPD